jgi:hypothetical protein
VDTKDWKSFFIILLFAIIDYLILYLIQRNLLIISFLNTDKIEFTGLIFNEILFSSLIGIIVSFIASLMSKFRIFIRIANLFRVTRRITDNDLWTHFNDEIHSEAWVHIIDSKLNLDYNCWLFSYSETDQERELILTKVF